MPEHPTRTDGEILADLGHRVARRRLDRNQTQADLAREAGVSKRTLIRLEAGESTQLTTLVRVLRVLEIQPNLDALVPLAPPSPVEQLRARGKERKRASRRKKKSRSAPGGAWTWGEGQREDGGAPSTDPSPRGDEG